MAYGVAKICEIHPGPPSKSWVGGSLSARTGEENPEGFGRETWAHPTGVYQPPQEETPLLANIRLENG